MLLMLYHGRREYQGSDLRDKLDKRHSPLQRYSHGRDVRGRYASHGYSPSRSIERRSDRKHRKRQQLDGQSDFSGSGKISDSTGDRVKDKNILSSETKDILEEQLRQVQLDIAMLDDHKSQLEIYLEQRVQEEDSLTSKVQELEMQLSKEKEECKRITSKIKKFTKAHNRYSRIQDELKRSQARLQKLGDQLGSDTTRLGADEGDSNVNILSDGETIGNQATSPRNEPQKRASPSKKRPRSNVEAAEEPRPANLTKGERFMAGTIKLQKLSRWSAQHAQSNDNKEAELEYNGNHGSRPLANEDKPKQGKNYSDIVHLANKLKGSESGLLLSSTGMAAHAEDDVEVIEMGEKIEVVDAVPTRAEKEVSFEIPRFPFPLPPPPPHFPQNAYAEYEGGDENVDVDGLEEDTVDVDIV
ncbi:zinc finger CCCH domain-containing protein 13 isoform X2 [Cornus florida]|uniref:zinc finger CCCH domain-containing protein 13 isoform X2 n=1 Tax=Cornus florida TaxID=4283 RepID=UPI0028A1895E|nr:zinc finger CCCH domain-containing protein 13 isoform X2 [Cornus florida]XP_059661053.1 zinc finger CCCH domain-containing protein 13 isoform X2 [Cornus florida]XP_059661055.1 zinc finger CCCH domain-containing protein 13 isoform X2 [Cornus florida]